MDLFLYACVHIPIHIPIFEIPWTVAHQAPLSTGIFQARILEWVAISSSRGSSQPRDQSNPHLMSLLHWQADSLPLSHLRSPLDPQPPVKKEKRVKIGRLGGWNKGRNKAKKENCFSGSFRRVSERIIRRLESLSLKLYTTGKHAVTVGWVSTEGAAGLWLELFWAKPLIEKPVSWEED